MTLLKIFFTCFVGSILAGCGAGPTPRLMDLVGEEAFTHGGLSPKNDEWRQVPKIVLVVHADATAKHAAPAIHPEYLETLTRRTEKFLRQRCSFQEILIVPPLSTPGTFSQDLKVQGQRLQVPYEIVVVFSSREKAGPEKIGEATMMTQMGGTVIENTAMAEVGILRVSDFKMVFLASGLGTESLEQLDAPIGTNRPSISDARDILRARAGQQALDRALEHLGSACQGGM
ncbi:MAG: hypothetical protein P8X46_04565 [Nitrospirales bacterium]